MSDAIFDWLCLLEGADAPVCDHCDSLLTIDHILVHCRLYAAVRHKYDLAGKAISNLLDDEADIVSLVQFLKEIDIFYKL